MIEEGTTGEARMKVQHADTAEALALEADDRFPTVFATSRMVSLMELAAARVLRPLLGEGELSVGVGIRVTHDAPTPIGAEVRAVATYLGADGKLHRFRLEAFDGAGAIGSGEHTRAIVATERLLAGAARRQR
jgi:predicted thioesterase